MTAPRKSESPAATGLHATYQQEPTDPAIFQQSAPIAKDFATLRAQFALRGRILTRSRRVPDGRVTFVVSTSWAGSLYFTHWHDVQGHLNQVMESRL